MVHILESAQGHEVVSIVLAGMKRTHLLFKNIIHIYIYLYIYVHIFFLCLNPNGALQHLKNRFLLRNKTPYTTGVPKYCTSIKDIEGRPAPKN